MITTKTLQVEGLDKIQNILRNMPAEIQRKLTFQALRKAAKPMKDEATANAPKKTGRIKKAMVMVNNKYEDLPGIMISVTKGKQFQSADRDAWYARFQEYGTSGFGKRRRSLRSRELNLMSGKVERKFQTIGYKNKGSGLPAREFMQRAFDSKAPEAKKNVVIILRDIVTKYWNKYAPKYAN